MQALILTQQADTTMQLPLFSTNVAPYVPPIPTWFTDPMAYELMMEANKQVYLPSLLRSNLLNQAQQGTFMADWVIVTYLFILLIVASVKLSNENYFTQLFQSMFNHTIARRFYLEKNVSILHESFRTNAIFVLSAGMMIFHLIKIVGVETRLNDFLLYVAGSFAVTTWLMAKSLLYRFIGEVFQNQSETEEYLYHHHTSIRIMGLVLLLFSFTMYFLKGFYGELIMLTSFFICLFLGFKAVIRGLKIIFKKEFSIYYPFLYLCTLEIAPVFVVGIMLVRWI